MRGRWVAVCSVEPQSNRNPTDAQLSVLARVQALNLNVLCEWCRSPNQRSIACPTHPTWQPPGKSSGKGAKGKKGVKA